MRGSGPNHFGLDWIGPDVDFSIVRRRLALLELAAAAPRAAMNRLGSSSNDSKQPFNTRAERLRLTRCKPVHPSEQARQARPDRRRSGDPKMAIPRKEAQTPPCRHHHGEPSTCQRRLCPAPWHRRRHRVCDVRVSKMQVSAVPLVPAWDSCCKYAMDVDMASLVFASTAHVQVHVCSRRYNTAVLLSRTMDKIATKRMIYRLVDRSIVRYDTRRNRRAITILLVRPISRASTHTRTPCPCVLQNGIAPGTLPSPVGGTSEVHACKSQTLARASGLWSQYFLLGNGRGAGDPRTDDNPHT